MGLFEKILIPVDGSRYSLNAVRLAARLGAVHGSELRLVHVLDACLLDQLARISEKAREGIREELRHSAEGFLSDMRHEAYRVLGRSPDILIEEGLPYEVILEEATSWGADLIVMGKLGKRGTRRILLGSVAERVIEFSELPVLTVAS